MGVINPDRVSSINFSTIEGLAKRFPQLGISDSQSVDTLTINFMDLKLSLTDLPSPDTYKSATGDDKPRPGKFGMRSAG